MKRYIPDFKNQEGALNVQFLVRQYPGSVQTVASSTVVYSTTTKVDFRARGRQAAVKIVSSDIDSTWRFGTLRFAPYQVPRHPMRPLSQCLAAACVRPLRSRVVLLERV